MGLQKYAAAQVLSAEMADGSRLRTLRTAHRHAFQYTPREGYLYVRSRAISSRTNDNFDEFPAEEIKKAYRTFVGRPVFVNHHNDDHRRARGVIIDAALHEDTNPDGSPDTWTEVLMEVDAKRFPLLAKAILAGEIDRTSMGTDVKYSVCTVCGNRAETPLDYCAHIPRQKGQWLYRTTASGEKVGTLIAERCYGLNFFENSLLVEDPADPTAFFLGVEAGPGVQSMGVKASIEHEGALPDGVTIEHRDHDGEHVLIARHPSMGFDAGYENHVGHLTWFQNDPEISAAEVHPNWQRKGIATELLRRAREITPGIRHSDQLSDAGRAWSRTTGAKTAADDGPSVAGVAVKAADTGRVLMLQRSIGDEDDPAAGTWEFPGGHVEGEEGLFNGAVREWQEETGHSFPSGDPGGVWDSGDVYRGFLWIVPSEEAVPIHDLNAKEHINPDDPDGDDTESVAWWEPEQLPKNPAVRDEVRKGTNWDLLGVMRPKTADLQAEAKPRYEPGDHPWYQANPVSPQNIINHFDRATPEDKEQGRRWYSDANLVATAIAGGDAHKGAGVLAAYSPQAMWPTNMFNAARALHEGTARGGKGSGVFATESMRKQAQAILDGQPHPTVLKGPKIQDFAHLIEHGGQHPADPMTHVVIDRHALAVAAGKRLTDDEADKSPLDNRHYYNHVAEQYRQAAHQISERTGEHWEPHQVQAATWLVRQRENALADAETGRPLDVGRERARNKAHETWVSFAGEHYPALTGPGYHSASLQTLALGEQTAPAEVDTLRDEECPVCGESDSFNGEECVICGYIAPPRQFRDPDPSVAQNNDLRQDREEAAEGDAMSPVPSGGGKPTIIIQTRGGTTGPTAPDTKTPQNKRPVTSGRRPTIRIITTRQKDVEYA